MLLPLALGAQKIFYSIVVVPYYNYSIMGPETLFSLFLCHNTMEQALIVTYGALMVILKDPFKRNPLKDAFLIIKAPYTTSLSRCS